MLERTAEPERERRYAICTACEHRIVRLDACSKCLCYLPAKTSLKNSRCPLGKWSVKS